MASYKYNTDPNLFVDEIYNKNYTTNTNKFRIGNVFVTMMLLSSVISSQNVKDDMDYCDAKMIYDNGNSDFSTKVCVPINDYQLIVNKSLPYDKSHVNYYIFFSQFETAVKDRQSRFTLSPLFNILAHSLEQLNIERSYVDVSVSKQLIEFHLNLGKGIYASVLKGMNSLDDRLVDYTISVSNELMSADRMSLDELQEKLLYIQKSLRII